MRSSRYTDVPAYSQVFPRKLLFGSRNKQIAPTTSFLSLSPA